MALVLLGTLYDGYNITRKESKPPSTQLKKLLICFSALENGRKVLSTKTSPSDLSCLHGIRVLSATWIILYHAYLQQIQRQTNNKFGPDKKHVCSINYSTILVKSSFTVLITCRSCMNGAAK